MWREREMNFVILSILLFCFALTTFAIAGFSAWLSALTLMSKVPPNRSMVGLGAANAALLCAVVSWPHPNNPGKAAAFVLTTCWGIFLLSVATSIARNYPALPFGKLLLPALGLTVLSFGLMRERLKEVSLLLLALVSIAASCWFNPLVRGGTAYLYRNPLASKMRSLSAHHPGARWATFGNMFLPDYPRLLGLAAINGTEPYPQFDFWARLDPQRRDFDEYNRYAHVWFTAAPEGIAIHSPFLDQVRVALSPNDPVLAEFGVRFFLVVSPEDQFFDRLPQLAKRLTYGRVHVYEKR
jgi:hypothetical protein